MNYICALVEVTKLLEVSILLETSEVGRIVSTGVWTSIVFVVTIEDTTGDDGPESVIGFVSTAETGSTWLGIDTTPWAEEDKVTASEGGDLTMEWTTTAAAGGGGGASFPACVPPGNAIFTFSRAN